MHGEPGLRLYPQLPRRKACRRENRQDQQNNKRGLDITDITGEGSKVKVLAICTNEELMIARDTKEIVEAL